MRLLLLTLLVLTGLFAGSAQAASPEEEAQLAELERVRRQIADQVQLSAYDLVDELVVGWKNEPVFAKPTPVVLAGVTVPVGLGTGLQALLENHISGVLVANPDTNVQLVHCPACTAVVVQSGPEATVVSRGVDNPETLADLGDQTGKHALFIDVEAEGTWLVLRARITRLDPDLPIVWSHTVASSASTPALLREATDLKTVEEARAEYLDALHERGPITIPVRLAIRAYAQPEFEGAGVPPPPFLWIQSGAELAPTDAHAWTSSLIVGYSFIPQAYQGLMGQARVNRLVTGRTKSLTKPNLYLFTGAAVMQLWGPSAASFRQDTLNLDEVLNDLDTDEPPRTVLGTFQVGADLRVGNRIGFSGFLETMPYLRQSDNIGEYVRVIGIGFHTVGTEVTFCF